MRVLVVDQDSASNEAVARSLRELFTVDVVTNKGDCLDLLRSNTFEVIVAAERLADGSGLELLGQISKKWPSVLRIFAADRHRLQLLRGRLGPFELFQTLAYPIDPERLTATLNLAEAAQNADADTSNIQHVVLGSEPLESQGADGSAARGGSAAPVGAAARVGAALQGGPASRGGVALRGGPGFGGGPAPRRGSALRGGPGLRGGSAPPPGRAGNARPATSPATIFSSVGRDAAPSRSPVLVGSGTLRPGRSRGAPNKATPVRFPPLERSARLEPTSDTSTSRSAGSQANSFAEATATARAARSNFDSPPEKFDSKPLALMIGGGAAVVLAVVVLGVKLLGSKNEPPPPAAPVVVPAPRYPQEVTGLIAQTESALKADDFTGARADVDKLRQLAPSHPRLAFFEGLLAQQANASKRHSNPAAAAGAGTKKRDKQPSKRKGSHAVLDETGAGTAGSAVSNPQPSTATEGMAASGSPPAQATAAAIPAAAQTPAEVSASPTAPAPKTEPGVVAPAAAATSTAAAPPVAAATPAAASAPSGRPASDEPPPVVREAKVIRRVTPDYPAAAKKEAIEGFVDLDVSVSTRGVVDEVSVTRATPPGLFDKSAVAAVRKWKYDPRFVDGLPTAAHLKVHLDFGPDK